jgi:hypothetical protein
MHGPMNVKNFKNAQYGMWILMVIISVVFTNGDVNNHTRHRDTSLKAKMNYCNSFFAIHVTITTYEFHCCTVHFNSLNIMSQQMHIYIIKH